MRLKALIACTALTLALWPSAPAAAATVRYEAENAPATCDGTIDSDHAGFSGTGSRAFKMI